MEAEEDPVLVEVLAEEEERNKMPKKKKQIITNKAKSMPFRPVIQRHHITYNPVRTVLIYKGEHYILTQLQWRRYVSKGFIAALKQFIKDYQHIAFPLKQPKKKKVAKKKPTKKRRATTKKTGGKSGAKRPVRKTRKTCRKK